MFKKMSIIIAICLFFSGCSATIKGRVLTSQAFGVSDVIISDANHIVSAMTNSNGVYYIRVPRDFKGKLTPQKKGYTFEPSNTEWGVIGELPLFFDDIDYIAEDHIAKKGE